MFPDRLIISYSVQEETTSCLSPKLGIRIPADLLLEKGRIAKGMISGVGTCSIYIWIGPETMEDLFFVLQVSDIFLKK
jgi:hypothetical protein